MPPRASASSAKGRLGRPRRVDDDDDDDEDNVNEEDSDNSNAKDDVAMQNRLQDSDGSDYASSAGDEDPEDTDASDADADADSIASDAPRRTQKARAARAAVAHGTDTGAAVDHRIPTYTEAARVVRTAHGPYKRGDPPKHMVRTIYGAGASLFSDMCARWSGALPSASLSDGDASAGGGVLASPWLPEHFEDDQIDALRRWYGERPSTTDAHLAAHSATPYYPFEGTAYILAAGSDATRVLRPRECMGLPAEGDAAAIQQMVADLGGETDETDKTDKNDDDDSFLLHAGGEICTVAWAPVGSPHVPQLLAIAAMPHKTPEAETEADADAGVLDPQLQLPEDLGIDTDMGSDGQPAPGSIQLWAMALGDGTDGTMLPRLDTVVCFDWGWPKRMAWCPVPLVYDADEQLHTGATSAAASRVYGMLAMLTDDGIVRVVEAGVASRPDAGTRPAFVRAPLIAALQIHDEPGAAATCLSWVGVHELVLGHADGSVTLWDIGPSRTTAAAAATMLLRLPAHDDCVLDVCAAYPSHPYLVASRPVQGVPRLVDLRRAATEHTYHPTPSVSFQPALLAWSDHLQGFVSTAATNNPVNGRLDFFPATHFPLPLFLVPHTRASLPTCLAVAAVHPYLAVGRSDGSVCVVNMLEGMFRSARKSKLTAALHYVFNSEWRAVPSQTGTAVGALAVRTLNTIAHKGVALGSLGLAKHAGDDAVYDDDDADADGDADAELDGDVAALAAPFRGPSLMRIHDPHTRVASVAWNPNLEYGTWCAIGLASGLVSIKKLAPKPI